jgi:predicted transcriptional regulator
MMPAFRKGETMPAMSNDKIATLCAVGEGSEIKAKQRKDVDQLVADGFVEPMNKSVVEKYKLTPKGQQFISERGAGLNEA